MTTVVCLRHGETDWNATRRLQGWAPTPLNDRGREQAAAAGAHLAASYDVDRLLASDLRRTRETATVLHESGVEPAPVFESTWRERDFGVYQGLTYDEMFSEYPEFAVGRSGESALALTPERGESLLDLRERVVDGFDRLLADSGADETVLVVTHGGVLYALVSHLTDTDFVTVVDEGGQGNCAVNEFRAVDDGVEAVRTNDTSYRE
ncbi:histidine phosphatase family protein [Halococcus hamelinensis]|uniref:Fructose-2,6-bisphosphatase n=1 Tax=Halococcus hamelinensis 100A6 TaxID=1132509 RepID=M0M5W8_9EURY|nr:histidine phosphatase family protein [Halococcus hamelinensis]EMA41086.1 fructose-2,6-bisphosphatase [Halococcus hamelinensis 100A6]